MPEAAETMVINMKDKIRDENIDYLFRAILTLENAEDCYNFFTDLCTVAELKEMSKRIIAAKMLRENTVTTDMPKRLKR